MMSLLRRRACVLHFFVRNDYWLRVCVRDNGRRSTLSGVHPAAGTVYNKCLQFDSPQSPNTGPPGVT